MQREAFQLEMRLELCDSDASGVHWGAWVFDETCKSALKKVREKRESSWLGNLPASHTHTARSPSFHRSSSVIWNPQSCIVITDIWLLSRCLLQRWLKHKLLLGRPSTSWHPPPMPWQSLYNFKPGASKRKEQQPIHLPPEAPIETHVPDPYNVHAYAPAPSNAGPPSPLPVLEHQTKQQVSFAADAWPPRYACQLS